jgi:hypothetical protein
MRPQSLSMGRVLSLSSPSHAKTPTQKPLRTSQSARIAVFLALVKDYLQSGLRSQPRHKPLLLREINSVLPAGTSFGDKLGHFDADVDPPDSIGALNSAQDHHSFCSACPTDATWNHTLEEKGCIAHTNSWALTYPPRVSRRPAP